MSHIPHFGTPIDSCMAGPAMEICPPTDQMIRNDMKVKFYLHQLQKS
jgi:hypothetical protein